MGKLPNSLSPILFVWHLPTWILTPPCVSNMELQQEKVIITKSLPFSYWKKKGDLQKCQALQTKSTSRNRSGWVCFLVAKSLGSNPKGLYAVEPDSGFYLVCVLGQLPKQGSYHLHHACSTHGPLSNPSAHILLLVLTELFSDSFSRLWPFQVYNSPHT